ncbi:MAG: radical SAM protein [Bacteroidaceae bacterium]|nr:radical SAM protein [Bacteroidaceae bacterium]
MKSVVFNPEYHLRQDGSRVILFSDAEVSDASEEWFSFIHPFHAMMFSFFDGQRTYIEELEQCATFFNIPFYKMEEIVNRFLNKQHWFTIRSGNHLMNFPKNVLLQVEQRSQEAKKRYTPNDFKYIGSPDYDTIRLKYPISINMELTMKCYVNCVYCYANRNLRDRAMLTMSEIRNVITQAKQNGVFNIDVNGGDVLLHPNIKEILQELVNNGYSPLVSTKAILTKDMMDYIVSLKKVRMQISLDSVNKDVLHKLIGVPDSYITDMSSMLEYLSKKQAKIQINVVLTKYNSSIVGIKDLLDYIAKYCTVKEVRFSPCGCSLYKKNFEELVLSSKQMQIVLTKIEELSQNYPNLKIKVSSFDKKSEYISDTKEEIFQGRALCTGGTRTAVLLPNGDMTICEELYDNPHFVLGNVRKHTIEEIWNSPKAVELYKSPIKENSTSTCNKCISQHECRTKIGVCWKLVLMAYGTEQWDYPDPRCPKAPLPFNRFYYE